MPHVMGSSNRKQSGRCCFRQFGFQCHDQTVVHPEAGFLGMTKHPPTSASAKTSRTEKSAIDKSTGSKCHSNYRIYRQIVLGLLCNHWRFTSDQIIKAYPLRCSLSRYIWAISGSWTSSMEPCPQALEMGMVGIPHQLLVVSTFGLFCHLTLGDNSWSLFWPPLLRKVIECVCLSSNCGASVDVQHLDNPNLEPQPQSVSSLGEYFDT